MPPRVHSTSWGLAMSVPRSGTALGELRRATVDPALPREQYALLESGSERLEYLPTMPAPSRPSATLALGVPLALLIAVAVAFMVDGPGTNAAHWAFWAAGWMVMAAAFGTAVWLTGSRSPLASCDPGTLRSAARRYRAHYVTGNDLEPGDRPLLRRAQSATDAITSSRLYADGLLDQHTVRAELAAKEWAIATDLRALSNLRVSRQRAVPGRPVSRYGRKQLRKHVRSEHTAERDIRTMVQALEARSRDVRHADADYADFLSTDAVAGLGDRLRDLLASVSAHREQADGITSLEQQSAAVSLALDELRERPGRRRPFGFGKRRG